MILRVLKFLAFTSLIVALLSLTLALCTISILDIKINYDLLLLIFFGTLTIYNVDHIRGLQKDLATNPERVRFIRKNLKVIYLIVVVSFFFSVLFSFKIGFKLLPVILIPFILGLAHRRLKKFSLFSAIYITLSWVIVTTVLPTYLDNILNSVYWLSLVIGISLFCNAKLSTIQEQHLDLSDIKFTIIFLILNILLIFILGGVYTFLLPIPLLTALSLLEYKNKEFFEAIYLDGSQLLGAAVTLLLVSYFL